MLDIGIAVAIALLLAVTAYLGTHLTMHPAETMRQKFWYKAGFAICGLVGCALIGVQTWRNNQTQDDLRGRLSRIEKNTKEPPKIQNTINVPPAQVIFPNKEEGRVWIDTAGDWVKGKGPPFREGSDMQYNVGFHNTSQTTAATDVHYFYITKETSHRLSRAEEEAQYEKFARDTSKIPSPDGRIMAPNSVMFITLPRLQPFSEKDASAIRDTTTWLYFLALMKHTDAKGQHRTEFCTIYSGTGISAVGCILHNGPVL